MIAYKQTESQQIQLHVPWSQYTFKKYTKWRNYKYVPSVAAMIYIFTNCKKHNYSTDSINWHLHVSYSYFKLASSKGPQASKPNTACIICLKIYLNVNVLSLINWHQYFIQLSINMHLIDHTLKFHFLLICDMSKANCPTMLHYATPIFTSIHKNLLPYTVLLLWEN